MEKKLVEIKKKKQNDIFKMSRSNISKYSINELRTGYSKKENP